MGILLDEYMMLLQTQNGGKVIVDTRPALKDQLKKIVNWVKKVEVKEYDQQVLWHCIRDQDFQELLKEVE